MDAGLRDDLVRFIRFKFRGYPNVWLLADDIVQEGYLSLRSSSRYTPEKENFGYLSITCLRLAYRQFMSQSKEHGRLHIDTLDTTLIDETDFAAEVMEAQNAEPILESLSVLREIERIVIRQRYYGDFSFAEIAEANGLKLSTVLSHHRRALEKLRPKLTRLLGLGRENYYE